MAKLKNKDLKRKSNQEKKEDRRKKNPTAEAENKEETNFVGETKKEGR